MAAMFEVTAVHWYGDHWQERDGEIHQAAGRHSDYSGAKDGRRNHSWRVADFAQAAALRGRLSRLAGVRAALREL